jgi:hypothetical protein
MQHLQEYDEERVHAQSEDRGVAEPLHGDAPVTEILPSNATHINFHFWTD